MMDMEQFIREGLAEGSRVGVRITYALARDVLLKTSKQPEDGEPEPELEKAVNEFARARGWFAVVNHNLGVFLFLNGPSSRKAVKDAGK